MLLVAMYLRIASLAALDACGTNEAQANPHPRAHAKCADESSSPENYHRPRQQREQVELLVELRTLAEAERALQTAMPLACKATEAASVRI